MDNSAPIVLFTYNRIEHTKRTLDALKSNIGATNSTLLIFSDGPKSDIDKTRIIALRSYLKSISGFRKVEIIERDQNLGLSRSIISGLSEIFSIYDKAIILEDDLVTSKYFLKYMNEALNIYSKETDVISIHGYIYPVKEILPETFFLKGADCWGWATWKRGWDLFEKDGEMLLQKLHKEKLFNEFNFKGYGPFKRMLNDQIAGKNDSWAIRWYASAFLQNKYTLYPGTSLVQNIGNDSSGTHSGSTQIYDSLVKVTPIHLKKIRIVEAPKVRNALTNYFKSNSSLKRRIATKIYELLH